MEDYLENLIAIYRKKGFSGELEKLGYAKALQNLLNEIETAITISRNAK